MIQIHVYYYTKYNDEQLRQIVESEAFATKLDFSLRIYDNDLEF